MPQEASERNESQWEGGGGKNNNKKRGISKWRQWGVVEQVRSKSRLFQLGKVQCRRRLLSLETKLDNKEEAQEIL